MPTYVEKEDHPKCFVKGCNRPRKYNEKGKYKGKFAQACKQCGQSPVKRQNASHGCRQWVKEHTGVTTKPVQDGRGGRKGYKIADDLARAVYETCEYLLMQGWGVHDELVAEIFDVSKYTILRIRLAPAQWNIPLPALKVKGGPRVAASPATVSEVKRYLKTVKSGNAPTPTPAPKAPPAPPYNVKSISDQVAETETPKLPVRDGMDDYYDSQAIDGAFRVVAEAIESRDKEIASLKSENALLRESQTNQVYNAVADKLLKRFGHQLRDKEGGELRTSLKRLMEQKPGIGE